MLSAPPDSLRQEQRRLLQRRIALASREIAVYHAIARRSGDTRHGLDRPLVLEIAARARLRSAAAHLWDMGVYTVAQPPHWHERVSRARAARLDTTALAAPRSTVVPSRGLARMRRRTGRHRRFTPCGRVGHAVRAARPRLR